MTIKSEIWVQATLRRLNAEGHFSAVVKRGAAEAGAVFIIINRLDGSYRLLGPAPGSAYTDAGDRSFVDETAQPVVWGDIHHILQRRQTFDPDIWIVEVESRSDALGLIP